MATKICEACNEPFTPHQGAKGKRQRACSLACGGRLRQGHRQGGSTKRHVRSGAVGDHEPCRCSKCVLGRSGDRTALIAKVAAEMGVQVTGTSVPQKKPSWAARHKAIRDGIRARSMGPTARRV